jgi:hypothetical protein
VRVARVRVREQYPGDPTWLAYCCFADPMARVDARGENDVSSICPADKLN